MRSSKESNNNDPTVIKDTVTRHAKRQRLTNIDLSRDPTTSSPNEERVESLLNEIRRRTGKKPNKIAARRRLNR